MHTISEIAENKKHYDGMTLAERMKSCHTPAISIAIVENFEISEAYAYGVKGRVTKEKAVPDTLFQAASISKPVFAAAIMRLAESGTLDIDTDISKYLADYDLPTYDNQKHKVTLRQILSHNAGLNLHGFFGHLKGQRIPTIEEILTGALPANHERLKLIKEPETGSRYSGGGYVLAQKIMSDVCQNDFCNLMDALVLSPFSMTHSTFLQPLPKARLSEIALGYNDYDLQIQGGYNVYPQLSAAGLWTTPSDLAQFGLEIMKALIGKSDLLQKETALEMTTSAYENHPFGVGFGVGESKRGLTFGHGGSNIGYHANMVFCPADGSGIAVMQNSDIGSCLPIEVTNSFMEIYGW